MNPETEQQASWRWRAYSTAIVVTLAAILLWTASQYDPGDPESRLGGDYPAFYGAGSIVADGDWSELYSAERQQAAQAGYIDDDGGYLYFSYPPFVAQAYGLLALVDYQWSFLVHACLMGLALIGAILLIRPWLDALGLPLVAVFVIGLSFQPVLRSVLGGQNTMLTLLLFAAAARFDRDDRPFLAGLVASLLLFKPQFGVVVVPLILVARRWRMLAGWSVGAIGLYGLSAALMGGSWVGDWWSQAASFRDLNAAANGSNFISIPGFVENAIGSGTGVQLVGYGLAVALGAMVALLWRRGGDFFVLQRWSVAAAAAVLVAPQTLFYDAGVLLLVLVAAFPLVRPAPIPLLATLVAVSWTQVAARSLGWSPLGPLSWALAVAVLVLIWHRSERRLSAA